MSHILLFMFTEEELFSIIITVRNFIFGIITAVALIFLIVGAYRLGKQRVDKVVIPTSSPEAIVTITPTTTLVGSDRDEHGCIGSAGYQWCASKSKCLRQWEESCPDPNADAASIKQALINKHNWTNIQIEVTISKDDGTYATGGVKEIGSEVGGGYFFAIKENSVWKIVADGNGVITCANLEPYPQYPKDLIPECYDEKTGAIVKR